MSDSTTRTQVGIVGGGPAGSLLAFLLQLHGVECVIMELRPRDYVLGRIRAGVVEFGSGEILRQAGLSARMDSEGFIHDGVNLAFADRLERVDF
ncbi:MAG: FAD-dependent monooxygenase, partial [Acidimicrobiia bacterium]